MDETMRILIIHPEGNVNYNIGLAGIAGLLHSCGYQVDIICSKRGNINQSSCSSYKNYPISNMNSLSSHDMQHIRINNAITKIKHPLLNLLGRSYCLIIGVDAEGIVIANAISSASDIPLAFISYEIFFGDEVGQKEKEAEIAACRNVSFAICQDSIRALKLSEENSIPLEKIMCIPVSGSKISESSFDREYIRKKYGVAAGKKIALYMGTLDDWAGKKMLLQDIENWPDDWVLLLHGRYSADSSLWREIHAATDLLPGSLIFSDEPFADLEELYRLPMSADIGIALYYPDFKSRYRGKNLQFIGLSSGKISTYLSCSLPILVNKIGAISDDASSCNIGYVIDNNEKISDKLRTISPHDIVNKRRNCRVYFEKKLDIDNYKHALINEIQKCTANNRRSFPHDISLLLAIISLLHLFGRVIMMAYRKK